ncbi:DUF2569 domain-containing protein [Endozoicomonas ascidiicola]|uniref:DUF2569 domain-containing protein n=1 Tax=Endozoicomonas ascidiicola TaxID=1698521 RepID=UPI000837874B|nr:DUF2569 domain-containing protein [Endozoicomonas ascidiicola]
MKKDVELKGLSGGLILFGLGVVLSPFKIVVSIFNGFSDVFEPGVWTSIVSSASSEFNTLLAGLIIFEVTYNSIIFALSFYLIYLFFSKKTMFVRTYIAVTLVSIVLIPVDSLALHWVFPEEPLFDKETLMEFFRILFAGLIWIPYLLKSRRVKNTFINPVGKHDVRNFIGVILTLVVISLGALIIDNPVTEQNEDGSAFAEDDTNINKLLINAASTINQNLPMHIDSDTRLDSTTSVSGNFIYKYTLINYTIEDIDIQYFINSMSPVLKNGVCTSEEMKVFVEMKVPIKYMYYDRNGSQVTTITIMPNQCT